VLSININNNVVNLSVSFTATFWRPSHCRCSLQQTSTVCQCVTLLQRQWDSRRVCVFVQLLTIMIRGSYGFF